jgi:hypothetical protein
MEMMEPDGRYSGAESSFGGTAEVEDGDSRYLKASCLEKELPFYSLHGIH